MLFLPNNYQKLPNKYELFNQHIDIQIIFGTQGLIYLENLADKQIADICYGK